MKVKSKIVTGRDGKPVKVGDIIELDNKMAENWISLGYGEAVQDGKTQTRKEPKKKVEK